MERSNREIPDCVEEPLKPNLYNVIKDRLILIGIVLAVFFWILESVIHAYVFHDKNFIDQFLRPDVNEIWMRLVVCIILICFSVYANLIIKQLRQVKSKLQQFNDELEFRIIERTSELNKTNEKLLAEIAERKKAENQARIRQMELFHVSRISTIGEMASSFAHELNQPLCAILGCSELCLQNNRQGIKNTEQFNENLETIMKQTERAGNIVHRIRDFVKKQDSHREPVDINNLIRETLNFIDTDIRHNDIKVNRELSEQIPKVIADSIQIQQVLINLLRNALESMAATEVEKRSLTIRTSHTSVDSSNSIKVMICDNGSGFKPEIKEQLFRPFFSTKSEGLGIGLSISHSIIEAHKGEIWAKCNSECGSTFCFTLPTA